MRAHRMNDILIEHDPSPMKLEVLGVEDWPVCSEAVSVAERLYARTETTYIVQGCAEITPQGGETVVINPGDLVTFMPESRCTWKITEAMERHYCAG